MKCSCFSRLSRLIALIIKEFQIIWSDPRNRIMIILPPLLQMTLFAFAATLEVNNISMVIYDKDNSQISRGLTDKFENTPIVKTVYHVNNQQDMTSLIDRQKVYLAITIPNDFAPGRKDGSTSTGRQSDYPFTIEKRTSLDNGRDCNLYPENGNASTRHIGETC